MANERKTRPGTAANIGYEAQLWRIADALRGSMDAAEDTHVVLGLIFLKYISDAFEAQHTTLEAEQDQGADPENPDEYWALNIFWVPPEARWPHLKARAKQASVGQLMADATAGIERDNSSLKAVLPWDYARPVLDTQRLGQPIDLISNIKVGDAESRAKDVLGRVYESFLAQFGSISHRSGRGVAGADGGASDRHGRRSPTSSRRARTCASSPPSIWGEPMPGRRCRRPSRRAPWAVTQVLDEEFWPEGEGPHAP